MIRSRVGELAIQSGLLSLSTRQAYIIVARGLRRERTVKAMSVGVVVKVLVMLVLTEC